MASYDSKNNMLFLTNKYRKLLHDIDTKIRECENLGEGTHGPSAKLIIRLKQKKKHIEKMWRQSVSSSINTR